MRGLLPANAGPTSHGPLPLTGKAKAAAERRAKRNDFRERLEGAGAVRAFPRGFVAADPGSDFSRHEEQSVPPHILAKQRQKRVASSGARSRGQVAHEAFEASLHPAPFAKHRTPWEALPAYARKWWDEAAKKKPKSARDLSDRYDSVSGARGSSWNDQHARARAAWASAAIELRSGR